MRAVLRFVDYKVTFDPAGEATRQARCVSGDEEECGAESKELGGEQSVVDWMAEHAAETGHRRFHRLYSDYALVEPKP